MCILGPYNCSFKSLRIHIQLAKLNPLQILINNYWSSICDVGACIETSIPTCSPTGYALDVASIDGNDIFPLPIPHESTATILHVDKFHFISIPISNENQPPEVKII